MKSRFLLVLLSTLLLMSCKTSRVVTDWKTSEQPVAYNKILVIYSSAGILDSVKMEIEEQLSGELAKAGYRVVPNTSDVGFAGLDERGEEESYMLLCEKGIDIILAVTEKHITKTKLSQDSPGIESIRTLIYKEGWNQCMDNMVLENNLPGRHRVELVLFDLSRHKPLLVLGQQKREGLSPALIRKLSKRFIKKMTQEGVIFKEDVPLIPKKAF